MQSARGTPTPTTTSSGRQLTQADINEYRQIFEAARQSRPISPLLPPSPPSSSAPDTETSPESSSSHLKRKHEDSMSIDISVSSSKPKLLEYHVPIRGKRKPPLSPGEISHTHTKRGTELKRAGDADARIIKSPKGAQLYAQSILNYAFGFFFNRPPGWKSLTRVLQVAVDRFSSLASKEPSPKLDVFLSYLHFLQHSMEIQIDRENITRIRTELDNQLRYAPNQNLQSPVPNHSNQAPDSSRPSNPSEGITRTSSAPDGLMDLRKNTDASSTLNWDDTRRLRDILARSRGSSHDQNIRRRNINHLTPWAIRAHFPRTFMRAFGENGVGHIPLHSSIDQDKTGPLEVWEDTAVSDLEINEEEGGDFPYPHQPEDILWVVILGRALLGELD